MTKLSTTHTADNKKTAMITINLDLVESVEPYRDPARKDKPALARVTMASGRVLDTDFNHDEFVMGWGGGIKTTF